MLDEKIELLIDGHKFANWFDLEVTLSVDTFDSIGFSAPFEPDRKEWRDLFKPFGFAPVKVLLNGDPLFSGTMIDIDPQVSADSKMVVVKCYAFPGVLCDCTAPTNAGYKGRRPKGALKTEFKKGLSLKDIAQQLCDPFDLDCEFRGDVGPKFDTMSIGIDKKIHEFLVPLAKQRGFVITNTEEGKVLFWKTIKQGVPRVQFVEGVPPLTTVRPKFSPQDYHSQITGYSPAKKGHPGGVATELNPWLGKLLETTAPINEYRPLSCKFDETERADAQMATRAKLGRMFGAMVSWDIEDLPTWRDPEGKLWDPNTSITLLCPGAMVYRESELLIREVRLRQSTDKLSASLNVVLPGAWSGEVPRDLALGHRLMSDQSGIVQLFERSVKDGVPLVEVQVDTGGGRLLTLEHVDSCGTDAPPLAADAAAIGESTGEGAARSAGYADTKNAGKALGGEHRTYARDPDTGEVVCEIWLKGPGKIAITALKAGADIELSTAASNGNIVLNGVKIDPDGNITAPGEVMAKSETTPVKLSSHLHPTGVGPSGAPTPGT